MGAVYLAFDDRLQRKVALKVMLPKAASNTLAKERFLREARTAAQVSSDHVVNIYEAEEIDGIPYIALQYLQGYPLDEYLKKKGMPSLIETLRIGKEVAQGLAAAHELGLVHRDIKPGNIWLEAPNGRVKIVDFGLAKPVENRSNVELTDSGALIGTPAYMSPEQGMGEKLDARSDLFSMGCVLYRLVTGKLPFDRPSLMGILTAIATEEPTPVQILNPDASPEFANLIHSLLAKKPELRPDNAKVVAQELDRLILQVGSGGVNKPLPMVIYAPMAVSVKQSNPFEDIDLDTKTIAPQPKSTREKPKAGLLWLWLMLSVFGLLCSAAVVVIIVKITKKDGKINEIKEVNDKPVTPSPNTALPPTQADPDRQSTEWVFAQGGTVRLNEADDEYKKTAELPKGRFVLSNIQLAGSPSMTDEGLVRLKDLKGLSVLNLHRTRVTDAGLIHLKELSGLTFLSVEWTKVTDAGLIHLKELKGLKSLYLAHTPVTDTGLEQLKGLKRLNFLSVKGAKVTSAGVAAFHEAIPGCRIVYDDGVIEAILKDR